MPCAHNTCAHMNCPERTAGGSAQQLIDPALGRRLVLTPPRDLGPVPDPVVARVVELDLDDDLGAELDPFQLAVAGPAGRVAHPSLAGLVRGQARRKLSLLLRREPGGVADRAQDAGRLVQPQDERADGPLLLARA